MVEHIVTVNVEAVEEYTVEDKLAGDPKDSVAHFRLFLY